MIVLKIITVDKDVAYAWVIWKDSSTKGTRSAELEKVDLRYRSVEDALIGLTSSEGSDILASAHVGITLEGRFPNFGTAEVMKLACIHRFYFE
jgi:hypothetical protein